MTGTETTTKRSHLLRSLFISFNLSIFLLKLLQVGLLLKSGLLGKLWGKTWGQIQATQRGSVTTVPANLLRKSRVVFAFAVLNICFRGPTNMPSFLFFFRSKENRSTGQEPGHVGNSFVADSWMLEKSKKVLLELPS